jgi:hypothetical protein
LNLKPRRIHGSKGPGDLESDNIQAAIIDFRKPLSIEGKREQLSGDSNPGNNADDLIAWNSGCPGHQPEQLSYCLPVHLELPPKQLAEGWCWRHLLDRPE